MTAQAIKPNPCVAPPPQPTAYHENKELIARITSVALGCIAVFSAALLIAAAVGASIASFGVIPAVALITLAVAGGVFSAYSHQVSNWAGRLENDPAFKTMDAYVQNKCPGVTVKEAQNWADQGSKIIQQIGNKESELHLELEKMDPEKQVAFKKELLRLVSWHFIKLAIETGQGFEHGTIKFVDPDHKIAQFFEPAMYERASSHFHESRKQGKAGSMGCDPTGKLPAEFKHILMGELQPSEEIGAPCFSFLKLETAGTKGISSFLVHTASFVSAKILSKIVFESSGPNDRKEHTIPWGVKKARAAFLNTLQGQQRTAFQKCKTPQDMYNFASNIPIASYAHKGAELFMGALQRVYLSEAFLKHAGAGAVVLNPYLSAEGQALVH